MESCLVFSTETETFVDRLGLNNGPNQNAKFSDGQETIGGIWHHCSPERLVDGKILVYGGQQIIDGSSHETNQLWSLNPKTRKWKLESGSQRPYGNAVYGVEGTADQFNVPASLYGSSCWHVNETEVYIAFGEDMKSGRHNTMWRYE